MAALPTLIAPEPSSENEPVRGPLAAWATRAIRPTHVGQALFTLGLRPVEPLELGHGKPSPELNGVASHSWSGICVLLYERDGPVAESSAQSRNSLHHFRQVLHKALGLIARLAVRSMRLRLDVKSYENRTWPAKLHTS